jgi:hypothetical protein
MDMLRRLRSFPVCDDKGNAPVFSFRTWFGFHAGRGTTPGDFGIRAPTQFKWAESLSHVVGRADRAR